MPCRCVISEQMLCGYLSFTLSVRFHFGNTHPASLTLFHVHQFTCTLFTHTQVQRARVARAAAVMAERQRREKVQHENEDAELERMIASMPVLFRERVRKQVMVNRRQAARVANAIGGTNGARLMKGVSSLHEDKKEESKKASSQMSLPVPVLTEVYHQGGFDKHIERQKEDAEAQGAA